MINCNFTKKEMELINAGLKFLGNYGLDVATNIMQSNNFKDSDIDCYDALNKINELRGVIKYLLRES